MDAESASRIPAGDAQDTRTIGPTKDAAKNDAPRDPGVAPAAIGRYRILRLIGEGGMGAVYEAEQEQPRRTVALKVIKSAWARPELLRRFEQESQALARLHHPGIAQIYEAGTADTGFGPQPYFVMEFISGGQPLTQYADAQRLNLRQRLELMAEICDAVHHAHQRGIIHRDLKPGNILVDENGHPKILDFGVARITDSDAQATRQTDLGQLVGTLAYMSPEQALADPLELDVRSDVYALGVILYELLAGKLPYTLSPRLHEAILTIREKEPVPLSSAGREYRGDIETLANKALEKDKTRRYASAAELAADIRRYLKNEPILARPASLGYQLRKFTQRHKTLVAGVAAVFVVLVVGIIVSTLLAARARRAELAAVRERDSATAVNNFLENDLLSQASASTQASSGSKPDPHLEVRTALDRAAARITGKFASQPSVEASIRLTMGHTYSDLGLYPEAQQQFERALDLRRQAFGEQNADTLNAMRSLGYLHWLQGRYADAEPLLSKVVESQRRLPGLPHRETVDSMTDLAMVYRGRGEYAKAESLLAEGLQTAERAIGDQDQVTIKAAADLALVYSDQGKQAQAEPLLVKVLEYWRRVGGEEHPETLQCMNNLALAYARQRKYAEAEPLFVKTLEVRRRILGEEHQETQRSLNNLAVLYNLERKYAQAEPLMAAALALRRRILGERHPDTLMSMESLAALARDQGKPDQAEALYARVLELRRRVMGADHPLTSSTLTALGYVKLQQRKYSEAEADLRQVLRTYEKTAPDSWDRYRAESSLAASLAGQRKYIEAEALAKSGYEGMTKREKNGGPLARSDIEQAGQRVVRLYQDWGKPDKAKEWKQKLTSAK